jgi:pimeloyl-ACP methyl ester carboxylesterase
MTVGHDRTSRDEGSELEGLGALPVDGSDLTYRVSGTGPSVLLVHGIVGMLELWRDVQDALA